MRKRAQRRFRPTVEETKQYIPQHKPTIEKKQNFQMNKKGWVAIALIAIFCLVLFFNTFFNLTSDIAVDPEGEGLDKYYLSGPDPYYNLRLVEETYETGQYPYFSDQDPLLNYPRGARGGRAPLLNMAALGFSRFLTPFMDEIDAIGRSMQFVPALFGALLIFPVYFLGKKLFNWKAGLIAAFFIAIIPTHIGSGHGSAYSLFDHDSFNLLLFFLTFTFLIFSIREKNHKRSLLYAVLGGIPLAGLTMTWVDAQFLYVVIAIYALVQIILDIFYNKFDMKVFTTPTVLMFTGYILSVPVLAAKPEGITFDTPLLLCLVVLGFGLVYYILSKRKIPWVISLPGLFILGGIALVFIYFVKDLIATFSFLSPLKKLSNVIFGSGIYGSKVSMTIAEANTFQISHTVISFGPALYWLGWAGLIFLIWQYYKDKMRRDYLFIIILFIVDIWLTSIAGRFLNDMVPLIAILGGWITWFVFSKLDYRNMIRNIKSAGGGLHGLRRGISVLHIVGIIFIATLVIMPNIFITLDAATPNKVYEKDDGNWTNLKWEIFGEGFTGAYGLSVNKEIYWGDAFNWLKNQDTNIPNDVDRPAFISWWDYGFYEVALGDHPAVADNFQDGIPPASNFHTSTSEQEAVAVWIVRLLEGDKENNDDKLSEPIKKVLENHLDENATNVVSWMEDPTSAPSYGEWINEEYNEYISDEVNEVMLTVGAQWADNAVYHDVVNLFADISSDEKLTRLYHDLQEATGLSIRYYGVEGYDRQIFNIFAFLSDKSLVLLGAPEDEFIEVTYSGYEVDPFTKEKKRDIQNEPLIEYLELSDDEKRLIAVTGTNQINKDGYFDSMFYKTYFGPYTETDGQKTVWDGVQSPCINMKHFYPEYISDMSNPLLQYYTTGKAAVVIAKYYEGAFVNGTALFNGAPINNSEVVIQKNLTYSPDFVAPIDHDSDLILSDENPNGEFSVIAGEGSRLLVRRYPELASPKFFSYGFQLKVIDFNTTSDDNCTSDVNCTIDPNLHPITDDDAMRKSDNYERYLNITIEPGILEGYVFDDVNDNDKYNVSVDEPIKDATVRLWEILEFDGEAFRNSQDGVLQPISISDVPISATTDETGKYSFSDLLPGYYVIETTVDDYKYQSNLIDVIPGSKFYNVTKPKLAGISGTVYYDKDLDGEYNSGDEISGADVNLIYGAETIGTATTDSSGNYSFDSLIAGNVNGMQLNEYKISIVTDKYQALESIYPEENKTTYLDISLELIPVTVTGRAIYAGEAVEGVTIGFEPIESVEKNTAVTDSTETDENGEYEIQMQPGTYNVTAIKYSEDETTIYDSDIKELTLTKGQGTKSMEDFILKKRSVTVTGTASYEGADIENISITFIDSTISTYSSAKTDINGEYSVELAPGTYNVNAYFIGDDIQIDGVNYTYGISDGTKSLNVTEADIATGKTFAVELKLEEAI